MKFSRTSITIYALGFYTILLVWLSTDLITCKRIFFLFPKIGLANRLYSKMMDSRPMLYVRRGTCAVWHLFMCLQSHLWIKWKLAAMIWTSNHCHHIADVLYHCVGLNSRKWVCNHFLRWTQEAFVNWWQEDFDENRGVIRQETPERLRDRLNSFSMAKNEVQPVTLRAASA